MMDYKPIGRELPNRPSPIDAQLHGRRLPKQMTRMFSLVLTLSLLGCDAGKSAGTPQFITHQIAETQREEVNKVLIGNHPHFTIGTPKTASLNVDAFDFMIGKRTSDFAELFATANQLTIDQLHDERVINLLKAGEGSNTTYFVFHSAIGRTFGYDAQMDYLVIGAENDLITSWQLFAITEY